MAKTPGKPRGKPFQPGQSGNPEGRPAVVKSLQALAREHTEAAVEALVLALSVASTRVPAAIALLDRGYGRPIQTANVRVVRGLSDLSDEELMAIASDPTGDEEDTLH